MFSDPILERLVKKYPVPTFVDRSEFLFEDLVESIVSQQLSVKASDTIFKRFKALFNVIPSDSNGRVEKSHLRHSGLDPESPQNKKEIPKSSSGQALNSSKGLPLTRGAVQDDDNNDFLTPQQILAMPDEKIREAGISFQKISYIKSVADAFVSDLIDFKKIKTMTDEEVIYALTQIRGVGKWTAEMILIFTLNRPDVFSLGDLGLKNAIRNLYKITEKEKIISLSETWKPYRSTACWYLWRSLENKA